jgi:ubiquinone/menaquinone biosynthesis C-methylase UbiE
MGFYTKYILPKAVHFICSIKPIMRQREKVVHLAEGRVLEIGIGSGLNLPFYAAGKVKHVWGLDPSRQMWVLAQKTAAAVDFDVEFIEAAAEEIPLDGGSADTVLVTYTLCTIPEVLPALGEMRRVLKSDGQLVFCEHGTAPDEAVRRWQNRLNPIWQRLGGGCNLNRPIPALLQRAGFKIRTMDSMYLPAWRPASFNYWGTASSS